MEERLPFQTGEKAVKKVDVPTEYRYITPAVRLERKVISMLNPPPGQCQTPASDTASTSDDSARTTIVGEKGPLEERGSSVMLRASQNGQSPKHPMEEPEKTKVSTPEEDQKSVKKEKEDDEEEKSKTKITKRTETETRTQKVQATKEVTQVPLQEQTKETQEISSRTSTVKQTEVRMTSSTELKPPPSQDEESKSLSTKSSTTLSEKTAPPTKLETAEIIEFFEEHAPVRKDSGVQIAEQSVRHDTTNVMEFFQEQPVRQQSVQVTSQVARQEAANVIEFFEEQDHFTDDTSQSTLLVVPSSHHGSFHRGPRSSSPSSLHASVGLNHLDNLIRLMEQLSNLKDENVKLRKKCEYLETTKNLLKARSELMTTSDSSSASGFQSLPAKHHKGHHVQHHRRDVHISRDSRGARPRLSSAEDVQSLQLAEAASDQRSRRPKSAMHKRSFSTGSLEVEILDETSAADGRSGMISKSKSGKSTFSAKSPKQKSKSSRWARVKKVLTGQFWYEDLGTTLKSLKEFGRSTQRYSSVSAEGQDLGPSAHRVLDTSLDSELLTSRMPRAEASSTIRSVLDPGLAASGGVEELGTEIWMGPPGWWEQYEAKKRQSEASVSSDVSSVIEVKTMYLGSKQKDTERLLKVKTLTRRQSSPSLITKDVEREDDGDDDDDLHQIHRSSSYKGEELDLSKDLSVAVSSSKSAERDSKKLHRKAWGRMKEMIHVRKDSVKKRSRRSEREGSEWSQGDEVSEVDLDGLLEEQMAAEMGERVTSKSTPKTSPMVIPRQATSKSFSESPLQGLDSSPPYYQLMTSSSSSEMAALLVGSMSEEFARKMHAWQELQLRKSSSFKITSGEAEGESTGLGAEGAAGETQELLTSPSVEAERSKSKDPALGQQGLESPTEVFAPVSEISPGELLVPSVNVEELQRRISESFSRKLAEWERRKYRRPPTPEMEQKNARSRKEKEDRTRSKKSREDKERERLEKAREREMQKVEKEQVKLEKEKVRIEKERLRAMERQAKLERMKGRLSQADTEPPSSPAPTSGSPPQRSSSTSQAQDSSFKVTADFKKKLHEWEQMKGPLAVPEPGTSSEAATPSPQPTTTPPTFSLGPITREGGKQERPPPLSLHPFFPDSPEERSPVDKASDASYGDDSTSVTEESLTKANIGSLERANNQLLREVQLKEQEYAMLQDEVNKLNRKLGKVRQEHAAEMARFKRELETGTVTGPVQLEVGELENTVRELEEKIVLMENAGDQLAESMESAAIGKWQSMEGEEVVSQQLIDMVDQMKGMLVQAAHTQEQSQKSMALHNFETVYTQAMKLQVQMNNLRVSQLERNKEIMLIKRQLLLQEVNNVLLQAHITRRETELYHYREAKRQGTAVRRWNTFSGQGASELRPPFLRNVSVQDSEASLTPLPASSSKHGAKHDDIPYAADENASIPAKGVTTKVSSEERGDLPPSASCPIITMTLPSPEASTDHKEHHLASSAALALATTTTFKNGTAVTVEPPSSPSRTKEQGEGRVPRPCLLVSDSETPTVSLAQQVPRRRTPETAMTAKTKTTTTEPSAMSGVSKVETGSPTLFTQIPAQGAPAVTVSPAAGPLTTPDTETPVQPIPERQATGQEKASLPEAPVSRVDHYSTTDSVMECTKSAVDSEPSGWQEVGAPSQAPSPTSQPASVGGVDIISKGEPTKAVRSPVSRQKYLRRQKEEREKRKERAASLKTSHTGDSGKPPLPRQSTPHQSPPAQRSRSVGDVDGLEPSSDQTAAPLRDVIEKFEKRATVCETEERLIEFRKTPSPTLHLPRVGLVSRVRRLKPAAELLLESQRYRSGQSIYATRIMNRYLPAAKTSQQDTTLSPVPSQDKENIPGTSYVQAIVKRLSRENTPVKSAGSSSTNSSLSLQRTDSPGRAGQSELVSHLIQKLSSSSGPVDPTSPKTLTSAPLPPTPLKDLTNEGQVKKMAHAFSTEEGVRETVFLPDIAASDRTKSSGDTILQPMSVSKAAASGSEAKPDSTISPASHASMPALAFDQHELLEEGARERAATFSASENDRPHHQQQQQQLSAEDGGGDSIEHIAEEFLDPTLLSSREDKEQKISPSSSTKSKNTLCCQSSTCTKSKSSSSSSSSPHSSVSHKQPQSPKLQSSRERMETIGVLCKQSMSFDLGVSLRAKSSPEVIPPRPQSAESLGAAQPKDTEGRKPRPSSTSSDGDGAPASSDDKKKTRGRFLDSSWLQKPKKFFKVSK